MKDLYFIDEFVICLNVVVYVFCDVVSLLIKICYC